MREKLITKIGNRKIFVGTFKKYGFVNTNTGRIASTILLMNVKAKGDIVADHAWITLPIGHESNGAFSRGDKLSFVARVVPYIRNCGRNNMDIGFACPTKIKRVR